MKQKKKCKQTTHENYKQKANKTKITAWVVTCFFFDFLTFLFEKCKNELVVMSINLL